LGERLALTEVTRLPVIWVSALDRDAKQRTKINAAGKSFAKCLFI
jgi:hypothetical protein